MKEQVGFLIDVNKCVGCHSCRVACQFYNDTGPAVNFRQVTTHQKGQFPDVIQHTLSLACNHCHEPACIKVCPVEAITKRKKDGIVFIDPKSCIGCFRCVPACPFGAPRKDLEKKIATKCHFCMDRQDRGLEPACVSTCLGGALQFGTYKERKNMAAGRELVRQIEGFSDPQLTNPSTRFIKPSN